MGALLKGVLFDLRGRNFENVKISLRAHYVHARHHVRNLLSPEINCISNSRNSGYMNLVE